MLLNKFKNCNPHFLNKVIFSRLFFTYLNVHDCTYLAVSNKKVYQDLLLTSNYCFKVGTM